MLRALRWMPSRPPGIAMRAPIAATRRSHATASCMPGADRRAVDRGDHGRRVRDDRVEHLLERGPERVDGRAPVGREARDEIRAGAERRARAGDDDRPQLGVRLELHPQLVAELAVERVAPLWRSIVASPTKPRGSKRITAQDSSMRAMRSPSCTVCSGLDVQLADDTRDLGDDRDLHLHRLEDADLVALGDHLPFLDRHLPHVRGDLGADLSHGRRYYEAYLRPGARRACARGRSTRLSALCRRPRAIAARVSAGSITSSS